MKLISAAVKTISPMSGRNGAYHISLILTHVLEQKLTAGGLTLADLDYFYREYSLVKRIILTYIRTSVMIIKLIVRDCFCQIGFEGRA